MGATKWPWSNTPPRRRAPPSSTVPSFQLRRDVLDEYLLATAVREGAELLRPAQVLDDDAAMFLDRDVVAAGKLARRVMDIPFAGPEIELTEWT